jgi:hypothetical protein
MNTKEKPKSWAVLNDGSQRFKDNVIKYMNDNDPVYAKWIGDDLCYYGLTIDNFFDCTDFKGSFYTILTIDEFCEIFLGEKKATFIEQAKEMEKVQMCQFAFDYQDEFFNNGKVPPIEQYYNETYGGEQCG